MEISFFHFLTIHFVMNKIERIETNTQIVGSLKLKAFEIQSKVEERILKLIENK